MPCDELPGLDGGQLSQLRLGVPAKDLKQRIERGGRAVVVFVEGGGGRLDTLCVGWAVLAMKRKAVRRLGWLTLQKALEELDELLLVHDFALQWFECISKPPNDQSQNSGQIRVFGGCGGNTSQLFSEWGKLEPGSSRASRKETRRSSSQSSPSAAADTTFAATMVWRWTRIALLVCEGMTVLSSSGEGPFTQVESFRQVCRVTLNTLACRRVVSERVWGCTQ